MSCRTPSRASAAAFWPRGRMADIARGGGDRMNGLSVQRDVQLRVAGILVHVSLRNR
jgi:hypothetical protein